MNILIILIINVAARTITRHQTQKPVQLYSKTGRHMTMSKTGAVGSTIAHSHSLSMIKLVPTGVNEFIIQSATNQLYLTAKRTGKRSGSLRLRGTSSRRQALKLTESVMSDNFNQYSLVNNSNCRLGLRKNGKFRILCQSKNDSLKLNSNIFDFLPRKVHNFRL